jgi:hypothetical protein
MSARLRQVEAAFAALGLRLLAGARQELVRVEEFQGTFRMYLTITV